MTSYAMKSVTLEPLDVQVRRLEVKLSRENRLSSDEVDFLRGQICSTTDNKLAGSIISCFQWLYDPANIPFVVPFLNKGDPEVAQRAVWALCWLGHGQHIKDYMISCLEPGLSWDHAGDLARGMPRAVGLHLSKHKDRDLAQLMIRWCPRAPGDPFVLSKPYGRDYDQVRRIWHATEIGMGYAVGADPLALTEDQELVDASVQRFLAERQDG